MKEIWCDVKGYEGLYQVSNKGRVKSLYNGRHKKFREKILSPQKNSQGYLFVRFYKNRKFKDYKVHRLVLSTFNPVDGMGNLDCNHLDENKENNNLSNLQWTTHKDNINHGTRNARVSEKNTNGKCSIPIAQLALDGKYIRSYKSSHDAEREGGGFNRSSIIACCKGKLKTHGGFKWMYLSEFLDKHNGIIN